MWRHCKAVVTFGDTGRAALDALGLPATGVGVVTADDAAAPADALAELAELLALHRVWDRLTPMSP